MPRKARQKSLSGIHHIILRGINQQIIFEDRYDYLQFLSILKYYKELCGFKLYAYCIMDNHIHLLVKQTDEMLATMMKRIEVKFVRWYNRKYQRIGYLFQDRYKSEPVNDMSYFMTVFRYIHQNPLHAGLEKEPGSYRWSSYRDYEEMNDSLVDIHDMLTIFPGREECMQFLRTISNVKCLEHYSSLRLPDSEALKIIREISSCHSPSDFQNLDQVTRTKYLQKLLSCGMSVRQISRLTGISRTIITQSK